jgi:outer membrane protein TolC
MTGIAQEGVLKTYIDIGLESNLALKQKESAWRVSQAALMEARSLFYPNLSLNARYTVSDGGRIIEFPVGDLLNPVYSTLNILTASSNFPQIENQSFPFLRPTEHETKLRLVQPVLNSDIYYNNRIRMANSGLVKADAESYRRLLVSEIKKAYYAHLQAVGLKKLLTETRPVLEENLRLNRKLMENGQLMKDGILLAEAELSGLDAKIAEAASSVRLSAAWFNFLLNRNFDDTIAEERPGLPESITGQPHMEVGNREELTQVQAYRDIAEDHLKMQKASKLPEIFAVVDYGFQGETYVINGRQDFLMASLVLQWDLFKGMQDKAKTSKARTELEMAGLKVEETERLLQLEVYNAWNALRAAGEKLESTRLTARASAEAFRMVEKRFEEGQAGMLEFMDARNRMTAHASEQIITGYAVLSAQAEYERAAGLYVFEGEW